MAGEDTDQAGDGCRGGGDGGDDAAGDALDLQRVHLLDAVHARAQILGKTQTLDVHV